MLRSIDLDIGAYGKHLGRQTVTRELGYTVTLASPFHHATIRILGSHMDVSVRVTLLKLGDYARDADWFARIEMRRKTVMSTRN